MKTRNLNRLLAWGHAKALETLLKKISCRRVIADPFGDERLILNALHEKGRTIVREQQIRPSPIWQWPPPLPWPVQNSSCDYNTSRTRSHDVAHRGIASRRIGRTYDREKAWRGTAGISCQATLQNDSGYAGENRLDRLTDLKDRRFIEIGARRGFDRNLPTPIEHSTAVGAGMEISPAFDF